MAEDRKYQDDEIREIFGQAAGVDDAAPAAGSGGRGLTLTELQDIGREVGLEPGRIAEAAAALERRPTAVERRYSLGAPIGVAHEVQLPRLPTDHEWEILVGELRRTFDARGKVSEHGRLREWTNGNLHVYVEATEDGHRLRMRTIKGSAMAATRMGMAMLGFAAIMVVVLFLAGELADDFFIPIMFALMGGGAIGSSVLTLPRWARERERQMEHVAERARQLLERPAE